MEIRRFFVKPSDISGNEVVLSGDEFLHMAKVLRYKLGFKAVILANDGVERLCRVTKIARDFATLEIEKETVVDKKSVELTLFAGLLKNNKLDFAIQKAVELGVDKIVPFTSKNTAETKFNVDRANRIALEAAKQCGSAYLSEVGELKTLSDVAGELSRFDAAYVAYENEKERAFSSVKKEKRLALIIGPEGGFDEQEIELLKDAGAISVTLGRRVLRAETASVVGCALMLYSTGELDYE